MTMSVTTIPLEPLISTARAETSHAGAAIRDVQYDRIQPEKKGNVGVMVSDSKAAAAVNFSGTSSFREKQPSSCLLYTSDAADDMQCVDLGCRRIIKKKKKKNEFFFFKQKTAYFFFSSRRRHTR